MKVKSKSGVNWSQRKRYSYFASVSEKSFGKKSYNLTRLNLISYVYFIYTTNCS